MFMRHPYEFTTDWFSNGEMLWKGIIRDHKPSKILEIGSFEGRSSCFIIEEASTYAPVDLYCIDTWEGSVEHGGIDFTAVEERWNKNIKMAITEVAHDVNVYKMKGRSVDEMAKLMVSNVRDFDMIYIDGSHMAADVLADATFAFQLLKVGGIMIFDDYYMTEVPKSILEHPQVAIEAFMSIYADKMFVIKFETEDGKKLDDLLKEKNAHLYQFYARKVAP